MAKKYPQWIDEYTKAMHQAFSNMLPCSWGPVDIYELQSYLNGSFVRKVHVGIKAVKEKGVTAVEVARSYSSLSVYRVLMWYLLNDYIQADSKPREEMREVLDWLVEGLKSFAREDMFALEKNVMHSQEEIESIMSGLEWQEGNPEVARELGKLYNSVAALAFALYRDFFPHEAHEVYAPYDVGEGKILVIKHFSRIKPVDLWPQAKGFKYRDVKIYQVFEGVKYRCEMFGMHSVYEEDLMKGLRQYVVEVDGRVVKGVNKIKELTGHFEELATTQAQVYDEMSKEQLVEKTLEWLCYQHQGLFTLAGMDWRPSEEMREAVKEKDASLRYECEKFPDMEEYVNLKDYEVYWMKELYS